MLRSLASRLLLTYLLVTELVVALAGLSLLVLLQSTPLADRPARRPHVVLGGGAGVSGGVRSGWSAKGNATAALCRLFLYSVPTLTSRALRFIAAPPPT